MEKILITRLGAMGDIIHALPAVAALRHSFPAARIGWVVEQRWLDLLCAPTALKVDRAGSPERPLADCIHISNTRAWRRAPFSDQTWHEMRAFRRDLSAREYETAVDLQGAARSSLICRLSGAPARVGFRRPRERWALLFYTRTVETRAAHVVDQGLELVAEIAGPLSGPVEFPLPRNPEADDWCSKHLARLQIGAHPLALISPGGGWGAKCWPPQRYGAVAMALAREGVRVLVNYGPGEESLAQAVLESSAGSAHLLPCTVGQLIALSRRARLFIGGDSGPTHVAAALRVPLVAIYGPTNPERNGPYATAGARQVVLRNPQSQTSHARRRDPEEGLLAIETASVIEAARALLGQSA